MLWLEKKYHKILYYWLTGLNYFPKIKELYNQNITIGRVDLSVNFLKT